MSHIRCQFDDERFLCPSPEFARDLTNQFYISTKTQSPFFHIRTRNIDLKSVDIVMILTALEEKFNVYIPMDGTLQEAKDVKSLIEAIADHIQKEREKQ